jgi:NTE family protein
MMRWVRLIPLVALACGAVVAAEPEDEPATEPPGCIGLVLGGGGARGAAHIGVLRVLERERIPVCAIAGTSMGAIVGSLYATGYSPDEIEAVLSAVDWADVFDDDPLRAELPMRRKQEELRYLLGFKLGLRDGRILLPRGVVQGQKLHLLLRRLLLPSWQVAHFDELPIPFRCVGTDIGRGEGVVFESGDLATAVRASMSVPGAFAPIRVDGRLMVDGGIYNNVPVDVVRGMGADRIIAVDVGAPLEPEEALDSPFAISMQMLTLLMNERTHFVLQAMQPGDIALRPDLGDIGSADFDRAARAVPAGEAAADAALAQLRELAVDAAEWQAYLQRRGRLEFDPPLVEFVEVVAGQSRTPQYVENRVAGLAGSVLDVEVIEQRLGGVYGRGSYETIAWALVERDGRAGIEVLPVDKSWGPNFITFALQVSDDFRGRSNYALAVEATATGFDDRGAEWRTRGELGQVTGLRTEFHQPFGRSGHWFVEPSLHYRALQQPVQGGAATIAEYRFSEVGAALELGIDLDARHQLAGYLVRGRSRGELRVGNPSILPERVSNEFGALGLRALHDSLDDADFPTHGTRSELRVELFRRALGSDGDGESATWVLDRAWSHGRHHMLMGSRLVASDGDVDALRSLGLLGGFANLSGYGERTLGGSNMGLLRGVYYRRFGDMTRLFAVPAFVGGSLEAGNVWRQRSRFGTDPIIAGSVFVAVQSPFGPLFLAYGRADDGNDAMHLSFGSLIRP